MASPKITATQVLFPVSLLSIVLAGFLGFQTTILTADRNALQQAFTQQDKPIIQAEKVKAQVNALAVGTLKLAQQGNKDAENIIVQLKKAGIDVSDTPPQGSPAPAAMTPPAAKP